MTDKFPREGGGGGGKGLTDRNATCACVRVREIISRRDFTEGLTAHCSGFEFSRARSVDRMGMQCPSSIDRSIDRSFESIRGSHPRHVFVLNDQPEIRRGNLDERRRRDGDGVGDGDDGLRGDVTGIMQLGAFPIHNQADKRSWVRFRPSVDFNCRPM